VRHRTDTLQAAVMRELERAGWSVQSLSQVGNGVPDLLVATPEGETFLIEVKAPGRKLSERQRRWQSQWKGRIETVHSLDELARIVGAQGATSIDYHCGESNRSPRGVAWDPMRQQQI